VTRVADRHQVSRFLRGDRWDNRDSLGGKHTEDTRWAPVRNGATELVNPLVG